MPCRVPALLLLALLTAGCAELREPAVLGRVPPGLGVEAPDPVPRMAAEAAAALADGGRSLAGNPAATARSVGQMEFLAAEFRRDPRWAPLPAAVESELRLARLEWRAGLGIRSGAPPEEVARALGRAALALSAERRSDALAALDPALFEPGGTRTLARLVTPGPLPQARIATSIAYQEVERVARMRLDGPSGALDPNAGVLGSGGSLMPGIGRAQ